jgi:hypothetical protein
VRGSLYAEYLDRVRAYHETAVYEKAMAKRKVWVEPLFGETKDWHGLSRFRLRRLWKVNVEALLIAHGPEPETAAPEAGWGRRPWPHGDSTTPRGDGSKLWGRVFQHAAALPEDRSVRWVTGRTRWRR